MKLRAHVVEDKSISEFPLAYVHPASEASVTRVLEASYIAPDGRSQWMWVRLPNGDLILGVYPQGETYEAVERDAQYPRKVKEKKCSS